MSIQIASDNFNRANEAPLSNGGNWGFWGTSNHLNVVSNAAHAGVQNNSCGMVWTGNTFPNDHYSQVTASAFNSTFGMGPLVRATNPGNANGYELGAVPSSINISIITNLVGTTLVSKSMTVNNGDILLLTVVGNTLSAYVNGTLQLTTTDSTYTSGFPGISIYDSAVGLTASLDNWSGGAMDNLAGQVGVFAVGF